MQETLLLRKRKGEQPSTIIRYLLSSFKTSLICSSVSIGAESRRFETGRIFFNHPVHRFRDEGHDSTSRFLKRLHLKKE